MKSSLIATAAGIALAAALTAHAQAMPNFAQAYGVQCSMCHTQVPALNAYGRYVQRTGYAALDPHILKKEYPVWIGQSTTYTEQTPNVAQWQGGNVDLHLDGAIAKDWTYHVQQWFVSGNQPGGLDTMWVAYNNLFQRSGHLFFGKVEEPAPSAYSQWFDLSGFASAEMTVGEHQYQLDANRWGTKFAYVRNALDAEIAYTTSGNDLDGFNDYTADTDKTLQYKLAYASPKSPFEWGYYGESGSSPLPEGGFDHYYTNAFYVQRDPVKHVPGFIATYQMNYDANPGLGSPATGSNGGSVELFEPIGPRAMLSIGKQFINDGMGTQAQIGNIDLSYHVMRFVHIYAEDSINQLSKPTWNGMIWLALPLGPI
ncbi:MAG TPA: hypothetical protein VNF68_09485 [Candidatus Baltobacteraceae bacterium]|nr:hypothetical protein [Candidatus Baltobacteraceae bacterium]